MIILIFLGLLLHRADSQAFTAQTTTPLLEVGENNGADLKCTYTSDFNPNPRIEWSLKKSQGSSFVFYDGTPTEPYVDKVTQYPGGLRFNSVTRDDSGEYVCAVAGKGHSSEARIHLVILVPPSIPLCNVPSSVTTGHQVTLSCFDKDASPAATYKWFKNNEPLPEDPSKFEMYRNMTYKVDPATGILEFPAVSHFDSGEYFCEASNKAGPSQRCTTMVMMAYDLNVGGIVAGVIFAILAVCLFIFGVWYAYRKGYISTMSESKPKTVVYTPPAPNYDDDEDGEFRQKSSFVV